PGLSWNCLPFRSTETAPLCESSRSYTASPCADEIIRTIEPALIFIDPYGDSMHSSADGISRRELFSKLKPCAVFVRTDTDPLRAICGSLLARPSIICNGCLRSEAGSDCIPSPSG